MSTLAAYLANQLAIASAYLKQFHIKSDPEILHQFRVHLRRVISLLKLYHPHAAERKRLKIILQKTNLIRDLDVLSDSLTFEACPDLHTAVIKYRNKKFRKKIADDFTERNLPIIKGVQKHFERLGRRSRKPSRYEKRKLLSIALRHYRKHIRLYTLLSHDASDATFHNLRIALKTTRYALNFLHENHLAPIAKKVEHTKSLQKKLGDIQDLSRQLELLKKICHKSRERGCKRAIEKRRSAIKIQKKNKRLIYRHH